MSTNTFAEENAMTVGDLQRICISPSAENKTACRLYILGVTQGVAMGMNIADEKIHGGRPCVPENITSTSLALAVKTKIGEDLMVFPDDYKLDAAGFIGAVLIKSFPCKK